MKNRNLVSNRNPLSTRRTEVWQPLREIPRLQSGIDQLFEDFFSPWIPSLSDQRQFDFNPPMDIEETDDQITLALDLPGVPKDAVKVEVRDGRLIISGEREEERHDEKGVRQYSERFYGSFQRSLPIPPGTHIDQIVAQYQDGVLRLMIPKGVESKPRQIKINESPVRDPKVKIEKEQAA